MSKKIILLGFALLLPLFMRGAVAPSGSGDYTYQKDLKVENIYQLVNQVFLPHEVVEGAENEIVAPGQVRIHIGHDAVSFKGVGKLGTFSIVSEVRSKHGYALKLVDARGSDFSELQVLTDKESYVQGLMFVSKLYGEYLFKLPPKSPEQVLLEKTYFTAKSSLKILSYKDLVGKTLVPYRRLDNSSEVKREEKITMKERFGIIFDANSISIKNGNQKQVYKIKRTTILPANNGGKAAKVFLVKVNNRKQHLKIYLNSQNQIQSIEQGYMQYSFM